jgi:RNA polymerase sigma factor (sigma-70 family)
MRTRKNNQLIDPTPVECADLLDRLRRDDNKAFDIIYNLYAEVAKLYAEKFVSIEDSREAAQFTFLKLWENRQKFKQWGHLTGFIYLTTRNYCINLLKKENREYKKLKEYSIYASTDNSENDMNILDQVLHKDLKDFINTELSGKKRKTMELILKGYKIKEVAKKLNITPGTAHNYKSSAFSLLRQKYFRIKKELANVAMRIFLLL